MQDYIEMVKAAAKQHRLELTQEEVEKFAKDVPEVLALFSKLDEYSSTSPLAATGVSHSELRVDEIHESKFNAFSNADEKLVENGFFVATRIKKQS